MAEKLKKWLGAIVVAVGVTVVGVAVDQLLVARLGRPYFLHARLEFYFLGWPFIAAAVGLLLWRLRQPMLSVGISLAGIAPALGFFCYMGLFQLSSWFEYHLGFIGWPIIAPFAAASCCAGVIFLNARYPLKARSTP